MTSTWTKKRTLDGFFGPMSQKKACVAETITTAEPVPNQPLSCHSEYPFPVPHLPSRVSDQLSASPAAEGRKIHEQPDLDLLYFEPFVSKSVERDLFEFLRRELFFYKVQYQIKRGPAETQVTTPRYTTVFGVDTSSFFNPSGVLCDSQSRAPILPSSRYRCHPRPIPQCLAVLQQATEAATSTTYNFCLVNYYSSGADSISYHSDDERFLGPNPSIASLSLGAQRDFLLKHKPCPTSSNQNKNSTTTTTTTSPATMPSEKPLKFPLASGDMVLMRGPTQAHWLHSIPKRKDGGGGRINITFRKAVARAGTENYYCYNVGGGPVWKWQRERREMRIWDGASDGESNLTRRKLQ